MIDEWEMVLHFGTILFFILKMFPHPSFEFLFRRPTVAVVFLILVFLHRFKTTELPTRWNVKLIYIVQIFTFILPYYTYESSFWPQSLNILSIFLILFSLMFTLLLPRPKLPTPSGRKTIGTTKLYLEENLITKVWYPSEEYYKRKNIVDFYMLPNYVKVFSKLIRFYTPFLSHFQLIKTSSYCDIPLSNQYLKYPIVIFSHDLYCIPELYTLYAEFFASNGFIVFGIYHTDGSACYVHFPKSEKEIKFQRVSNADLNTKKEYDLRDNQLKTRIENVKFLIDEIFQISQQNPKDNCLVDEFFNGRFDTSRIYVIGHSFGGITAAVSSSIDQRITSAIALDGWFAMFDIDQLKFEKKLLCINSEFWQSSRDKQKIKSILKFCDESKSYLIEGTKNSNFTDFGFLFPTAKMLTNHLGKGDQEKILNITNNLIKDLKEVTKILIVDYSDKSEYSLMQVLGDALFQYGSYREDMNKNNAILVIDNSLMNK
eukprot:gene9700-1905_t